MSQFFKGLQNLELEALREVSHIGLDHAADALSRLIGVKVGLKVPEVRVLPLREVPSLLGRGAVAALSLQILGDLRGNIMVAFPGEAMASLLGLLTGKQKSRTVVISQEDGSALKEVGNILASAYLSALSDLLRLSLIPSIPHLVFDQRGAAVELVLDEVRGLSATSLVIDTRFHDPLQRIEGHVFLLPHHESIEALLKAIKKGW